MDSHLFYLNDNCTIIFVPMYAYRLDSNILML